MREMLILIIQNYYVNELTWDNSDENINKVILNIRDQTSGSRFFRHRAGRIGASESRTAFHKTLPSPFTAFITCRKIIRNGMFISFFYSFSLFCGGTWYLAIHVPGAQ